MNVRSFRWLDIGFWTGLALMTLCGLAVLLAVGGSGQTLDSSNWLDYPLTLLMLIFRWSPLLIMVGLIMVIVFGIWRQLAQK